MIDHPRATVLAIAAAVALVVMFPEPAAAIEAAVLPFFIIGVVVSTIYLWRIYGRNPVGRIWRQVVGAQMTSLPFIVWVGYLVVVRLSAGAHEATGWFPVLPVPPPGQSAPISGLLLILAVTPSIRYALTVWRIGREAMED